MRFRLARCLAARCHAFEFKSGSFVCSKCGDSVATEKQKNGKLSFVCPGKQSDSEVVDKKSSNKTKKAETAPHAVHDVFQKDDRLLCKNCPANSSLSNSGLFKRAECLGDKAHKFVNTKGLFR